MSPTGTLPHRNKMTITEQENLFLRALNRAGVRDKMNFRLGEVMAITGMTQQAVLKMRDSLNVWRPPSYNWNCYPREQVKDLALGTLTGDKE